MKNVTYKFLNWRNIGLVFIVFLALKLLFDLHVVPHLELLTGGLVAPDVKWGQGLDYVQYFVENAQPQGLQYYCNVFFIVDIFFPLFMALLLSMLLAKLSGYLFLKQQVWSKLALLPFISMLADYLESIGIVFLIKKHLSIDASTYVYYCFNVKVYGSILVVLLLFIMAGALFFKKMRYK